jgi:hypothetical protein
MISRALGKKSACIRGMDKCSEKGNLECGLVWAAGFVAEHLVDSSQ